jgi:transitional endoplasmic reticulum ATPase
LDAASLRRFTFKLKFDYMDTAQARRLFKGYFGMEAPAALDRNAMLVPGDFANVRKQVEILWAAMTRSRFTGCSKKSAS